MVLGNKAWSRHELGDANDEADFVSWHTGVKALVDASKDVEASEVSSYEAQ